MKICPSCSAELPDSAKHCTACGWSTGDESVETAVLPDDPQANTPTRIETGAKQNSTPVTTTGGSGRFVSGTVLAGRYRIVGLIGKGGMGEVYKAEDLELEQTVALKFLPEELARNEELLKRFRGEVRNARQVSHPNVCRVFDIGETEGLYYLTMEYVDGDDLSMLLRRIGRFPSDRAVEVSRQICVGLAAIHKAGILHRDLKPANIIIDSKGEARITDFGIAGLEDELEGVEARVGTPAYMSPEQADGKELTKQSDLYSLGLLLYEIFTGKQAYEGDSVQELRVKHATTTPKNPSEIVAGIDPLVEKVISKCLEKDPKDRPDSALNVAMSLPGGDPLQVALEAGETPSPEMVAASSKKGVLRPVVAILCLSSVLISFFLLFVLSKYSSLHKLVPLDKSPDVLIDRSRELVEKFGYPLGDSFSRFTTDDGFIDYLEENDQTPDRWKKLSVGQPAVLGFWFRSSPQPIAPFGDNQLSFDDPPNTTSGMARIILDTKGRLVLFNGVPPRVDEVEPVSGEFNWADVLKEAGFDLAAFQEVESTWTPKQVFDERKAFSGKYPENDEIPIRVEAATYRGKLVNFEIVKPWTKPEPDAGGMWSGQFWFPIVIFTVYFGALFVSAWLAVRNIRMGRSDIKGALKVAIFLFALRMICWVFETHHVASFDETNLLLFGLQSALFWAVVTGFMYLAFEPYLRKSAPERVVAWSRLLAGDWRDPLIGRDLLIGGAGFSILMLFAVFLIYLIPVWTGKPPTLGVVNVQSLSGIIGFPKLFLDLISSAVVGAFIISFLLLFFSLLLRRKWLGTASVWLIAMALALANLESETLLYALGDVLFWTALILVAARFGLLASISFVVFLGINEVASPTSLSVWYAGNFVLMVLFLSGLAIFGFYTSTAGQWQGKFLEE